jgi:hypothetical protein
MLSTIVDTLETFAIPLFALLCGGILYMHLNTEVHVQICSVDGVTTYVNIEKPHTLLSLGECHSERMTYSEYHELKRTFKGSR